MLSDENLSINDYRQLIEMTGHLIYTFSSKMCFDLHMKCTVAYGRCLHESTSLTKDFLITLYVLFHKINLMEFLDTPCIILSSYL